MQVWCPDCVYMQYFLLSLKLLYHLLSLFKKIGRCAQLPKEQIPTA